MQQAEKSAQNLFYLCTITSLCTLDLGVSTLIKPWLANFTHRWQESSIPGSLHGSLWTCDRAKKELAEMCSSVCDCLRRKTNQHGPSHSRTQACLSLQRVTEHSSCLTHNCYPLRRWGTRDCWEHDLRYSCQSWHQSGLCLSYFSNDSIEEATLSPAWGVKPFCTQQQINSIHLKQMYQKITSNLILLQSYKQQSICFEEFIGVRIFQHVIGLVQWERHGGSKLLLLLSWFSYW